jgi:hypothetical protein
MEWWEANIFNIEDRDGLGLGFPGLTRELFPDLGYSSTLASSSMPSETSDNVATRDGAPRYM